MTRVVAFTVPRPFEGVDCVQQMNAILSWRLAGAEEVALWENHPSVKGAAQLLGCRHVMHAHRTAWGTPTIDGPFAGMRAACPGELLLYANADIVFLSGVLKLAETCAAAFPGMLWLATGKRWNSPALAGKALDMEREDWREEAWAEAQVGGGYHRDSGEDWFLYPSELYREVPPFAVGRSAWDNWLVMDAQRRHVPTVDATEAIRVLHPGRGKVKPPRRDPDWVRNQALWRQHGGGTGKGYITTTSHVLRAGGTAPEERRGGGR